MQVINATGTCQSVSNALVVTAISNQTPPVITPSATVTICSGDSVILESSSLSGNQWFKDGVLIPGAVRQSYAASVSGNYTVQVTGQAGCSATSLPRAVIAGGSLATPVITASDTLINCAYSKVLYSSSLTGNQWMRNGVALPGETGSSYIVQTLGSYSVQVTSGAGCSVTSAVNTILIITNPNTPLVTSADPLSFCEGGSALLHSSAAPAYQWYRDGVMIGGATTQDYRASTSGAYTVQALTAGCSFSSQPATVGVINNQTPATISPVGPVGICSGSSLVLTSSSASGNQWYLNDTLLQGATGQFYSASAPGSYTVKITVGTCNSSFSSPVVVNSSEAPATPTVTASGPTAFCQGGTVLLSASVAAGYQWYQNGAPIPGATTSSYLASEAGTYTVKTSNASACQATSAALVVTLASSGPAPLIAVIGPAPGCNAGQTVLISSSDLGNQWLKDGVPIAGAVQKTYFTDQGGNYSVALGYGSTCVSESQVVSVVGNTNGDLKALIIVINGELYSDSATGNQWYLNDTLIPGATDRTFTPLASGKYTLRITNAAGCMSTFSDPYFAKLENFSSPNVLVFPNPVTDYLTVVNMDLHPVTARIFDIIGRQILVATGLTGTSRINMTKLSGGTYVIQIIDQVNNHHIRQLILKY